MSSVDFGPCALRHHHFGACTIREPPATSQAAVSSPIADEGLEVASTRSATTDAHHFFHEPGQRETNAVVDIPQVCRTVRPVRAGMVREVRRTDWVGGCGIPR